MKKREKASIVENEKFNPPGAADRSMHRRLRGVGYLLGFAGFILFFISDANDWKLSCRALKLCFPVGFVLLAAGTARELMDMAGAATFEDAFVALAAGKGAQA